MSAAKGTSYEGLGEKFTFSTKASGRLLAIYKDETPLDVVISDESYTFGGVEDLEGLVGVVIDKPGLEVYLFPNLFIGEEGDFILLQDWAAGKGMKVEVGPPLKLTIDKP